MTKIEIGVVFAIIMILCALLYPAINQAMTAQDGMNQAFIEGKACGRDNVPVLADPYADSDLPGSDYSSKAWREGWIEGYKEYQARTGQ